MELGQYIKSLRQKQNPNVTQSTLAKSIGITQSYLSLIESGKKNPEMELIKKVADYFDLPLPIFLWNTVEESDIRPEKIDVFRVIKPIMDSLIKEATE